MKIPFRNYIAGECGRLCKGLKLFFGCEERSKFKTEKGAVIVFDSDYDLSLFIDRVYRIMVMMYDVVYILLGHHAGKEYEQHQSADYS